MNQIIPTSPNDLMLAGQRRQEPPENPHSPVRRLVESLFRSKGLVIVCAVLGATIGVAVGILQPNQYTSNATFLYQSGSENVAVRAADELQGGGDPIDANAPLLLRSGTIASRVVKRLGRAKILRPFDPKVQESDSAFRTWIYKLQSSLHNTDPSKASDSAAVDYVLSNIDLSAMRRTSLLNISYKANDPHLAREILTAYVDEAVKFHIEVYEDKSAMQLVQSEYDNAKVALSKARQAYAALLARSGLTNFALEYGAEQQAFAEAQREIRILEDETIPGLVIRIQEAEKSLRTTPPRKTQKIKVPMPNPLIESLNQQLLAAKTERLDALVRFNQNAKAPEVQMADRKIAIIAKSLTDERKKPLQIVEQETVVENPNYVALNTRLDDARIDLAVQRENLKKGKVRLARLEIRVKRLASMATEHDDLQRELLHRTSSFQAVEERLAQTRNKQRLAANQLSALRVVNQPSLNPSRVGPKRGLMALLGLLGGFAAAAGILGLRAVTDSTIRTPEELEQMLGVRVLATVPELRRKHVKRHESRLLSGC